MKVLYRQIKTAIILLLKLCLRLFSYRLFMYFRNKKNSLYSIWIGQQINNCGSKVRFTSVASLRGYKFIEIGNNTSFGKDLYLTAWKFDYSPSDPIIRIGNHCPFGAYNHITSFNKIIIGDGCLTGKWVTITDNSHGETDNQSLHIIPAKRFVISKGPVIIGKNVWIGDKATILPGVIIGDGAVIGANSIVTKDVPSYCVAAGNPAKIIKRCLQDDRLNNI